jgi:hypothetical protein
MNGGHTTDVPCRLSGRRLTLVASYEMHTIEKNTRFTLWRLNSTEHASPYSTLYYFSFTTNSRIGGVSNRIRNLKAPE